MVTSDNVSIILLRNRCYRAEASEQTNATICRKWYNVPYLLQQPNFKMKEI